MVVDEAARLSHQLGQRWTQASALTPKVPAQSQESPEMLRPTVLQTADDVYLSNV